VFTRPLGSRKATLADSLLSLTLYEPRASARTPALVVLKPLVWAGASLVIGAFADVEGDPIVRTRSAHDFGTTLTGGEVAPSADFAESSAPPLTWAAASTALARWSALDGIAALIRSEAAPVEARLEGREATWICGMAGTIGTIGTFGRPEALIFMVVG